VPYLFLAADCKKTDHQVDFVQIVREVIAKNGKHAFFLWIFTLTQARFCRYNGFDNGCLPVSW